MRQNQVPFQRTMDEDVLLVGLENQHIWLWGVRDDDDNPMVWERRNDPGSDWTQTGEHLDEFLWHFILFEALSSHYMLQVHDVTWADVERFTRDWTELDVKPWRWPGPNAVFWTRDRLLAWTMVNQRPEEPVTAVSPYSIVVGARSNDDLAVADDAGISWSWDSRTERRS